MVSKDLKCAVFEQVAGTTQGNGVCCYLGISFLA